MTSGRYFKAHRSKWLAMRYDTAQATDRLARSIAYEQQIFCCQYLLRRDFGKKYVHASTVEFKREIKESDVLERDLSCFFFFSWDLHHHALYRQFFNITFSECDYKLQSDAAMKTSRNSGKAMHRPEFCLWQQAEFWCLKWWDALLLKIFILLFK